MMLNTEYIMGAVIISIANIYISSYLLGRKINFKDKNLYISIIIYTTILLLTYSSTQQFFKVIINYFGLLVSTQLLFCEKMNKTAIVTLITFILVAVSEILYTTFIVEVTNVNQEILKSSYFVSLSTNFAISFFSIIILKIIPIKRYILDKYIHINSQNQQSPFILSILTLIFLSLVIYYIYFSTELFLTLIISITLILIFLFIFFKLINEMNENFKIQVEYDTAVKNLKNYEKMLSIQYMRNHENNNNLISIRGLIKKDNKDAINFINSILKDKKDKDDDQSLILKVSNIPTGGLQGLFYQKLLSMKHKGIQMNIEVSREIKKVKFNKFSSDKIKNVCTVVGVFLDNAIQAVENQRERMISIHIYQEINTLIIMISNNYENGLNIEEIDHEGYTTKSNGHGYGLSLVKKIISDNQDLINERAINGNIFSQVLKIAV